ncbi:phage head-tail connector protein [Sandaracinobacter sp. RS1-74]|uniref:head-tail connector protein n=1 Tax=Sandaracinobacteroides sayramensis TaxID=2913411 RepID=UPI001EDA15D7|nr:phage head-tail connector protein [Sandaracinobacteroides sayramensis]MCG2839762.1 phage head-tail connector protein [Sandaracinobacteroides sayramensis]
MLEVERAAPAAALAELKAYLRIEDSLEDALLAGWLRAATETAEVELGQFLLEREVVEEGRVCGGLLRLTHGPVRLVLELREMGTGVLPVGRYALDGAARLRVSAVADGVLLAARYRAGMADGWNRLPEMLRQAVVRLAAHFHGHRDSPEAPAMPLAVRQLLRAQRARRLR